mgnify:CR=1 FL=1
MSFRLDQGHGTCKYRVGVEDDGCHSLLDYDTVAKSCFVLEYLARSLNSVVIERIMIQNEVAKTKDSDFVKLDAERAVRIREPTALGDSLGRKDKISPEDAQRLRKGGYTRAELTIQKVETHELAPPSTPIGELTEISTKMGENRTANGTSGMEGEHTAGSEAAVKTAVGETMSARNILVAVDGNVDAVNSTLIGVSVSN